MTLKGPELDPAECPATGVPTALGECAQCCSNYCTLTGSAVLRPAAHKESSPEQSKEQQQWAGVWPGCAVGHDHPDPVEVPTDIGVDTRPVGPTTAYSPAHDSNLIPQPILFTGQGSA